MSANQSINEFVYESVLSHIMGEENFGKLVTYSNQVDGGLEQQDADFVQDVLDNTSSGVDYSLHTNSDDREFLDDILLNNTDSESDYSEQLDQSDEDFIDSL